MIPKFINVKTLDNLIKEFKIKNNFHVKIDIDKDLVKLLKGFKNSVKNTLLRSVLIETEISEKAKVLKFFKPYMKVLNLEKIIKNHSTIRRKKKKSPIRNIVFIK